MPRGKPHPAQQAPHRICGHCRADDVGTFNGGYSYIIHVRHKQGSRPIRERIYLCHPNVPDRPDCHYLVTTAKEELGKPGIPIKKKSSEEPKEG